MTLRKLIMWITFLAVFAMAARISVDTDTWWHLRTGQWIIEQRTVPQVDPFSYTRAGEPWKIPGWLVQVPMYLIYHLFGPGGLNIWTALMVTLAFVLLWHTLRGGPFLRAFILVLATAVSGVYWAARPYLMTFLLAAAYLWILEGFRWQRDPKSIRRVWWLPVLMAIWANSHGGFAVGFILWGVYAFAEVVGWVRDCSFFPNLKAFFNLKSSIQNPKFVLFWSGLLMILAVCLNPAGPVMLAYPFKTVSIGALQDYIAEWQSPNFHSLSVQPFIWLLLATFAAVGISRRRLALTDFFLVGGFAYMGLLAGRNVALFALAAPPVLARHAEPLVAALSQRLGYHGASLDSRHPRRVHLNRLLLALLLLAVLAKAALVFPASVNQAHFTETMPVAAVEYIRATNPPGRLFNTYNWGAYLLWALPEYPVFLDGRTDLYNDEVINQWLQVVRAEEGWQAVLDRWQVRLILLEPGMPVVKQLPGQGWILLYEDELAVVFGR